MLKSQYTLPELLDINELDILLGQFSEIANVPSAIMDLDGNILIKANWQPICENFHRKNRQSSKFCLKSDTQNLGDFPIDIPYKIYTCPHGLIDSVCPILIEDRHIANAFIGQILHKPVSNKLRSQFRRQAKKYDFDEIAYLQALENVPVISSAAHIHMLNFLSRLTKNIASMGLTRLLEREQTETIRENEEQLRLTQEAINDGLWDWDAETNILTWSPRSFIMLGYEPDAFPLTYNTFKNLIHPEDRLRIHEAFQQNFTTNSPFGNEFRFLSASGSSLSVMCRGKVISRTPDGAVKRVLGAFTDITEQKHNIKEKRLLEQQLQQAVKLEALGTLAGGIAHDFNNILSAILGHGQMALEGVSPSSSVYEDIQQIMASGNRAADLVKRILLFSRQEAENFQSISLQKIIQEVVGMFRPSLPSSIKFSKSIDWDCGRIHADPTQIHQIILNLCTNARQAIQDDYGSISIALSKALPSPSFLTLHGIKKTSNKYACIEIRDSGCGISPEIQKKIFDPFFTTKTQDKGTGLGLAVVDGIVRKHHGVIDFKSDCETGTVFQIYLPMVEGSNAEAISAKNPILKGNERILLVDDEPILNNVHKRSLEKIGYQVTCFSDSLKALNDFRENSTSYDIVITDMTMPNLTGLDLIQNILQINPDTKSILCTGYSESVNETKARSLGVNAYLSKPFLPTVLAETIRKVFVHV